MYNRFIAWLFMTEYKENAVDRDNDGLVQEGTPYERKVKVMANKTVKKAPVKKAPVKKAPVKKTVKKSTKKK